MAYDSARGVTVLFGGDAGGGQLSETWEWNGTNWTQSSPATSPAARNSHTMAYDSARGVTVLFGGIAVSDPISDTWEWDGTNWTQRSPATSPLARIVPAIAYDSVRGEAVLFGGQYQDIGLNWHSLNDTWGWNGTNWTQRSSATSPPARTSHTMAYDSIRGVTVLFGGTDSSGNYLGDTWEFSALPPTVAAVDSPSYCSSAAPATIILSATGGSGTTLAWYSGSCGGTSVGTGSPLTISAPTSTTIYFARWETPDCGNSTCVSVTVTVNDSPTPPTSASVDSPSYCAGSEPASITLTATGGSGTTLTWYSDSCGGTAVGTGSPLTIGAPTTTTTYFARWETPDCGNSTCASVTVTVNASLTPTLASVDSPSYCAGSEPANITLTATGGSGTTLAWYSDSCGGTAVGTGSPLTIGAPTSTNTYFARWETPNCGNSSCASVTVTVNANPTCSITGDSTVCPGKPGLTASATAGAAAYAWSLSGGAITAGQGTNNITYTAPSGGSSFNINLTVTDVNNCTGTCSAAVNLSSTGCNTVTITDQIGPTVTIAGPDGSTVTASRTAVPGNGNTVPGITDPPAGASFPAGLISLRIADVPAGGAATAILTIDPAAGQAIDSYYKFGPEPGNTTPHWYKFDYDGSTGAEFSGNVVALHFIDGQRGDSDLTANGIIDDPGAPAQTISSPAGSQITCCGTGAGACGAGMGIVMIMAIPLLQLNRSRRRRNTTRSS